MENSEWASVPKNVSLLWGSAVLTIVTFTSALLLPHTISTLPYLVVLWTSQWKHAGDCP